VVNGTTANSRFLATGFSSIALRFTLLNSSSKCGKGKTTGKNNSSVVLVSNTAKKTYRLIYKA